MGMHGLDQSSVPLVWGLGKGSIGSIIFFSLRGLLGLSKFHEGVLLLLGTLTIFRIEIPDCVSVRRPFSLF